MGDRVLRWGLIALAISALAVGLPALFAPSTFFGDFPFVAHWVDRLGRYNAHLVTDVGGLYLGFAILFAWAAVTLRPELVLPVLVAWSAAATAHLAFHLTHLDGFPTADAVLQSVSLAALVVGPLVLIVVLRRRSTPAAGLPAPSRRP